MPEQWNRKLLVCALFVAAGFGPSCAHRKAVVAPEPQAGPETQQPAPLTTGGGTTTVTPEPRISAAETPESAVRVGELPASVEGHCDERNTEEYNLALGWRRANAVKVYLAELGVGADRISTISYGEEKPFATCHNESCWWQNRRAHFVVTTR